MAIELVMDLVTIDEPRGHEASEDGELPTLLPSMDIEGLPSTKKSKHFLDAEQLVTKYVERWQIVSLDSYCHLGLVLAAFNHPGAVSADRLVAMGISFGILFVVDDLYFDSLNLDIGFLYGQYGIPPSSRENPHQMKEYLGNLINAVFGEQSEPAASPIEMIFWEAGREMLRLSNPEWFFTFLEGVNDWFQVSLSSHSDIGSGHSLCLQDLESYSNMRADNFGGTFVQLLTEFATNRYLTKEMRSVPFMVEARNAATLHMAFVNDLYSYHKESVVEENPRNVITVLMKCEGKTFVQAVHAAIGLVNLHARFLLDLETKTSDPVVQSHLQDIKELIAGHLRYSNEHKRYRQVDSVFPDLRYQL